MGSGTPPSTSVRVRGPRVWRVFSQPGANGAGALKPIHGAMSLIAYIIVLFLSGLFVGALARLALPGPDPMTLLQTAVVGIAGSFLAGVVWAILFHRNGGGVLLSVLFATGIVYLVRRSRGGDLANPGAPRRPR